MQHRYSSLASILIFCLSLTFSGVASACYVANDSEHCQDWPTYGSDVLGWEVAGYQMPAAYAWWCYYPDSGYDGWQVGHSPDYECPSGDPGAPAVQTSQIDGTQNSCGSIIRIDKQTLGERIPLVGIPFSLYYTSERAAGNTSSYQAIIPVTSGSPASNLVSVNLTMTVAGQIVTQSFSSPAANTNYTFNWNGLNGSGVAVTSPTTLQVDRLENYSPSVGGLPDSFQMTIGQMQAPNLGLGGWSIGINHYYDPVQQVIHLGNGSSYNVGYQSYGTGGYIAASSDASELYVFDSTGKHLQTLTAITGSTKYTFNYNGSNQLSTVVDAFGNTTTFNYTSGYLSSIVGQYGQTTTTSHDTNGYLSAVSNPNNETYNMTYTGTGGLLYTFQKPVGVTSTFTYTTPGLLLTDSSSAGSSTALSTTSSGNTIDITETSALSHVATHDITDNTPTGGTYSRTDTTPAGNSISYTEQKSSLGSLVTDTVGYYHQVSNTGDLRLTGMANFPVAVTDYQYSYPNSTSYAQSVSLNSSSIFDINTLTTTSTLNGYNTTFAYMGSTKTYTTTTPVGRHLYQIIDSYERPTSTQLASFTPFTYAYDTNGRLSTVSQGTGRVTTLSYNTSGYVSSVQNPASQTTSFSYDNAGRVTTLTLPDTRYVTYAYDSNGNLASVTPPGEAAHTLNHNGFDLLSSYVTPTALLFSSKEKVEKAEQKTKSFFKRWTAKAVDMMNKYSPKAASEVVMFTGFTTDYTYDNEKKLTLITRPDSSTISYSYDGNGTLSGITIPTGSNGYSFNYGATPAQFTSIDGTTENFTYQGYLLTNDQIYFNSANTRYANVAYTFGSNNNFQLASDVVTSNGTTSGTTINYGYDHDTLLTSAGSETITRSTTTGFVSTAKVGNLTETYSYTSDMAELSSILAKYNTTQDYSESFTRDTLGRISTRTEQYTSGTSNTYGYTYDSAGRLTTVTLGGTTVSSYSYDTNSNRISQTLGSATTTGTYDGQDRVSTFGTRTYTLSSSGELQSYSDSAFSPAHVTSFSYDVLGNLKSVTPPSGSVFYYKVDAQNRRIEKLTGTTVDNYFMYDSKNRVIALVNSSGAITSRFIYGVHPNTPDYMIKSGTTYKIISNHLGSPVQVVASSSGTISEQIVYDEFGNITSDSSPGFQPFGFAGCLYDTDTKLCHFGARDLDMVTGRWTNRDPILFKGGDSNLYGYVMNDPINMVDPRGTTGVYLTIGGQVSVPGGGVSGGGTVFVGNGPQGGVNVGASGGATGTTASGGASIGSNLGAGYFSGSTSDFLGSSQININSPMGGLTLIVNPQGSVIGGGISSPSLGLSATFSGPADSVGGSGQIGVVGPGGPLGGMCTQ